MTFFTTCSFCWYVVALLVQQVFSVRILVSVIWHVTAWSDNRNSLSEEPDTFACCSLHKNMNNPKYPAGRLCRCRGLLSLCGVSAYVLTCSLLYLRPPEQQQEQLCCPKNTFRSRDNSAEGHVWPMSFVSSDMLSLCLSFSDGFTKLR